MFSAPTKRRRRQRPLGEGDIDLARVVTFESSEGSMKGGRKRTRRTEVALSLKEPQNEGQDTTSSDDFHQTFGAQGVEGDFAANADADADAEANIIMAGISTPSTSSQKKVSQVIELEIH